MIRIALGLALLFASCLWIIMLAAVGAGVEMTGFFFFVLAVPGALLLDSGLKSQGREVRISLAEAGTVLEQGLRSLMKSEGSGDRAIRLPIAWTVLGAAFLLMSLASSPPAFGGFVLGIAFGLSGPWLYKRIRSSKPMALGASAAATRQCEHCGAANNPPNAAFCGTCGSALAAARSAP